VGPVARRESRIPQAAGIALVAALAALCWFGWLGWDVEYQIDPATGIASGPYEAWQVAGAVICLALVVVAGTILTRPLLAAATTAAAFTVSWALTQAPRDESGLWLVGALLVLLGVTVGASLLAFATGAVARRFRRHRT
jgi:hypothetical protein